MSEEEHALIESAPRFAYGDKGRYGQLTDVVNTLDTLTFNLSEGIQTSQLKLRSLMKLF